MHLTFSATSLPNGISYLRDKNVIIDVGYCRTLLMARVVRKVNVHMLIVAIIESLKFGRLNSLSMIN